MHGVRFITAGGGVGKACPLPIYSSVFAQNKKSDLARGLTSAKTKVLTADELKVTNNI